MKKRIFPWRFLTVVFVLSVLLTSCVRKPKKPVGEDTTTTDIEETGPRFDANGYLMDDLPEKVNLDREFNIYSWQDQKHWDWYDEEVYPTNLVDIVLYKRQSNIQDRFGITLNRVYQPGTWDNRNAFITTLANSVKFNDGLYDLVSQYTPCAGIGATQNLYADMNSMEYLDFSKPWWPSKLLSTAQIGERLYFASGDITPTLIRNVHCMFVNTGYYAQYQLADLVGGRSIYDVVRDYDWTLETLKLLALDHVADDGAEMFGLSFVNNVQADAFFFGGGFKLLENNNGILTISPELAKQPISDWFDQVQKLFAKSRYDVTIKSDAVFRNKQSIFHSGAISASQNFAQDGVQFSVLPIPMRNSEQESYYTCASLWVGMYSIPADAKNFSESAMILEALASEGYRTVTDEIYYTLFQIRYNSTDNVNSAEMFDVVSDSIVFDTARSFADHLQSMFAAFRNGVTDEAASWSSVYGSGHPAWNPRVISLFAILG
ncbi:MAG: hypothetical protein II955_01240 [Clostridia bacterium]|nr:hypothetical protein [Clostridia bacterium]